MKRGGRKERRRFEGMTAPQARGDFRRIGQTFFSAQAEATAAALPPCGDGRVVEAAGDVVCRFFSHSH